ncbi:multicopper oxidase domain-containing protein [Zhouia sp. PK063]|uniref:multicopper oxidase domain-containing protein n=1 Tax=Zhouia sp. PK063 TaxID=3373602 RepID=UPI00378B13FC
MKHLIIILALLWMDISPSFGQTVIENTNHLPEHEYTLTIKKEMVQKAGKKVMGMTVNGSIPGPTLEFTEGEFAIIHVKNEMNVPTSIHWHGILIPNYYDGVPYLTTPPIAPGTTFTYKFPIRQSGTYWYHSHTMLQEQSGVFGSMLIHPKKKTLVYDKNLVLMLSDWTNEHPKNVLRNLKRGNEWYGIKKGTATPLSTVIARGALGAQLNFWKQRMEGADIADVYYPAFLINGQQSASYPDLKPGEKVRLRIINGSSSTSYWMTFGGSSPELVAADGKDVVPVRHNKTFIAIAETYDFIITIPSDGKIELRAMAQDGSGVTTAYFGKGTLLKAPIIPQPDKIKMMKTMAKMNMKMGAPALKYRPHKDERYQLQATYGMHMKGMRMNTKSSSSMPQMSTPTTNTPIQKMVMKKDSMPMKKSSSMQGMAMYADYNYDYLKSPQKTEYPKDVPVKHILLNLTGNMNRYIWSLNGVPLSEADKIKISADTITRITFNNLTMMHHPMHLHGHFFRVLNENGAYSPLKHTVNVPPMRKVTIEFYRNGGDEYGDWFFHCHILYHMMSGMARIVSYDSPRDSRMTKYPESKLKKEADRYYGWSTLEVASHMTSYSYVAANIRNQFNFDATYGWNKNLESEVTYQRYLNDYVSLFGGVHIENTVTDALHQFSTTAIAGIRYLTPYLFQLDARIDHELRPQLSLSRSILLFPKTVLSGSYEYQADFGWVNTLAAGQRYEHESNWSVGLSYFLSRNFSLSASYDSRYGTGGGISMRF